MFMYDSALALDGLLLLLMLSAFVKVATALSILRFGLGLQGLAFGAVVLLLSVALSLHSISPQIESLGGLESIFSKKQVSLDVIESEFRPFLERNTPKEIVERLQKAKQIKTKGAGAEDDTLNDAQAQKSEEAGFTLLMSGFLVSELKQAFQIGFLIIIPFVLIDILVVNVLMMLQVTQISVFALSLPLKLLLFFSLDGWVLVTEKLLMSYQ